MTMYSHLAGKREFPNVTRFHENLRREFRVVEVDGGVAITFDGVGHYWVCHMQFDTWLAARHHKNEVLAVRAMNDA